MIVGHSVFIGAGGSADVTTGTYSTTATGTYTMNGGTLTIGTVGSPDSLAVGAGTGGFGTFVQNAGAVSTTNLLQIGRNNSSGFYHLVGGTVDVGDQMFVGGGASGQVNGIGTMIQDAGTSITITSVATARKMNVSLPIPASWLGRWRLRRFRKRCVCRLENLCDGVGRV